MAYGFRPRPRPLRSTRARRTLVKNQAVRFLRKYRGRRSPQASATFNARVTRVLNRKLETKTCQFTPGSASSLTASNGTNWLANSVVQLSPFGTGLSITQGTGNGQRIGNRIELKSLWFDFVLRPLPYQVTTNPLPVPVFVVMYFFTSKNYMSAAMPSLSAFADFYQQNNTSTSFANTLVDLISVTNSDAFTMKKILMFKLGWQAYGGTGVQVTFQSHTNNKFDSVIKRRINLTKYATKHVVYDDNVGSCTSTILQLAVQVIRTDNVVPGAGESAALMYYQLRCSYKDA